MIHPHTELKFINAQKGYGVVATRLIPKGTITWVHDPLDQLFTSEQIEKLEPEFQQILHTYSYRDNKGRYVLCWDHSRFVNHSFNSNCMSTAYNFELAVRDIYPGEELTDNYGYLNLSEPFECLPEPGTERTVVLPDDLLNYYREWDAQLADAFGHFNQVEQPFRQFIEPGYAGLIDKIAGGEAQADSILTCYYDDGKTVRFNETEARMRSA